MKHKDVDYCARDDAAEKYTADKYQAPVHGFCDGFETGWLAREDAEPEPAPAPEPKPEPVLLFKDLQIGEAFRGIGLGNEERRVKINAEQYVLRHSIGDTGRMTFTLGPGCTLGPDSPLKRLKLVVEDE